MIPKVSVIVPCYNVEKYVSDCLYSIVNQTLRDIEILVLNDGSTDGTINILREFESNDHRIKVYEHSNRGLGPTRNRGIELARGEYLAFVDSDDLIAHNMLEILYNKAKEENTDVSVGEVYSFSGDDMDSGRLRKSLKNVASVTIGNSNKEDFYCQYYFTRVFSHNACDKLYRRELIQENKILFGDNKKIFAEDNWFQLQVFMAAPKICFVGEVCYYYRQQEDSIMHKPKKELVKRHGQMISDYKELIQKNGNQISDKKTCTLVAFDILIMEMLNQKNNRGTRVDYVNALETLSGNEALRNSIADIVRLKAYKLEPKKNRKLFLILTSLLFNVKLYGLTYNLLWLIYPSR